MPIQQMFLGAGGAADQTYVDEVFSQYLYQGNDTDNRDIVNGIDLSGEGGAVWGFVRNQSGQDNTCYDTARGAYIQLKLQAQESEFDYQPHNGGIKQFNSNGFRLESGHPNNSGNLYNTYTFRKAEKFFDIVTYTGNGSNRTISHSLGSVPGMMIIKKRNAGSTAWMVYHRSVGNTKYMMLNTTEYVDVDDDTVWNDTTPTASVFSVGTHTGVNANNDTYVAYIFAHDESEFGVDGDASIIKCGTYTGNGQSGFNANPVDLGFEPQFVLIVNKSRTYENWVWHSAIIDGTPGTDINSAYHLTGASPETTNQTRLMVSASGFSPTYGTGYQANDWNKNGDDYIYMAIRRADGVVGKPIETGTDVFAMDYGAGSTTIPNFEAGFPVDMAFVKNPTTTMDWYLFARPISAKENVMNTDASGGGASDYTFNNSIGWGKGGDSSSVLSWNFRRHAGFDVVCYEGTGSNRWINHSLGRKPEMMWVKRRDSSGDWMVYHANSNPSVPVNARYMEMHLNTNQNAVNDSGAAWDNQPTATQFRLGNSANTNANNGEFINFLFASVDGVCKCGGYEGSSSAITITTGFQPRFVVIKNITDSGYPWVVLDTTRGWASGNDQFLDFSENYAQAGNVDRGAPTSTGFTVPAADVSGVNRGSGKYYVYYAHA